MHARLLIALLIVFIVGNHTIQTAQANTICFGSNERCIDGRIQEFWERNGSWDTFGIPLEPPSLIFPSGLKRTAQQFEKVRIEHQSSLFVPYDVFLGNIGLEWLNTFITTLVPLDEVQRTTLIPRSDVCVIPSESEISVCGPFMDYYKSTGINYDNNAFFTQVEHEALFGKPLTSAMLHTPTGLVVQVFEHLRLDYNPNTGKTSIGNINTELLAQGKSNLSFDLTPDSFMATTNVSILSHQELDDYITKMPNQGYWESSQLDVYLAMTDPLYLSVFYDKPAKTGFRFVTMSVLVRNQRSPNGTPFYYDFSYIFLKDLEGRRYETSVLAHKLALPVRGTILKPGESAVGQLIYEIPIDTAPAQLEMNFANMDEWISRWETTFELRTRPLGV